MPPSKLDNATCSPVLPSIAQVGVDCSGIRVDMSADGFVEKLAAVNVGGWFPKQSRSAADVVVLQHMKGGGR